MAWIIQNDELVNTDALGVPDKPFHGDSPYTFWRIDPNANDGMPYVGLMIGVPVLPQAGAFKDAAELEKVTIPKSCVSIGKFAFNGTQLKKVTIPSDCEYSVTSFPADCEVNFYGGGYGQLYDGDGFAVIDGDGCRAYINS
jgi:hypothetical protein